MSRKKLYLLPLILLIIFTVHSQLLAIDFGTQYIKGSVVHSGAGKAFSIVENSKSERKFLNALGFFNEQRFYESDTLSKRTKVPQNCFLYSRLLIDFHQNPSFVKVVKKDLFLEYINENIEDQFLAEFVLKNFPEQTRQLTLLEVMTMILKYIKLEAEKFVKGPIKDAVLVLPNYWSIHQRNFILQAAAVADIYVLSIVSQNTAASINYALSQRNQNKTENVLFYNVGSNALQMTLVEFKQVLTESSPKPVQSIFVKDDYGKPYVGGLRMDSIICKYFEEIFEQKYKKKLDKRGLIKLLAESSRVKETLSANKEASMFVQGIMDGIDFHSKITRVEFEKRAEQVFKELTSPLKRFLLENDIKAEELHSIELIGGGSRIPKIQSLIAEILNTPREKIGTHINGDQAMALGGAFFAANSSKKFKVKGVNLYDGFNFDIRLVLRNLDETIQQGADQYFHKNATIFKKKNRFGLNKEVNFKCTHNLRADLYKVDTQTLEQELLKSYEFDQIQSFNETDFKLSLVFTIDPIEVVLLKDSKFTYKKDEIQTYLEKVKKPKTKNETTQEQKNETDQQKTQDTEQQKEQQQEKGQAKQQDNQKDEQKSQDSKKKSDKKDKKKKKQEKVQYQTVQKNKTVTKKYEKDLKTKQSFTINKQQQKLNERTKQMLKNYQKAQERKRVLSESRNRLEAVIYQTKDKLQNEQFIRYSKQSERKHLQKLAEEKQLWHDESTSKNPDDYKKQYNELHKPLDRVKRRIIEHYQREHIRDRALAIVKEHKNLTESIKKGKQWITDEEVQELKSSMQETEKKIKEIFTSMQQTEINEDTVYQNKDMIKQAELAKDKYFQLKAKPKPTKKEEKKTQEKSEKESQDEQTEEKEKQSVNQDEL